MSLFYFAKDIIPYHKKTAKIHNHMLRISKEGHMLHLAKNRILFLYNRKRLCVE